MHRSALFLCEMLKMNGCCSANLLTPPRGTQPNTVRKPNTWFPGDALTQLDAIGIPIGIIALHVNEWDVLPITD